MANFEKLGGYVTSSEIFVTKTSDKFHPSGLFSEQIFGPLKDFQCACGNLRHRIEFGKVCPKCGVLCGARELRFKTFGKIKLLFPVIKPTKIKEICKILNAPNIQKTLLDPTYTDANLNSSRFIGVKWDNSKIQLFEGDLKELHNKYRNEYIMIPVVITGIYSLILVLEYLSKHYNYDNYSNDDVWVYNKIKKLFDDEVIIDEIFVLPPEIRPVLEDKKKKQLIKSKINDPYLSILRLNDYNEIYKDVIQNEKDMILAQLQSNLDKGLYDNEIISNVLMEYDTITSRYQYRVNQVYDHAFKLLHGKDGMVRKDILGRVINFSGRAVTVCDPSVKPYMINVSKKLLYKLLRLEFGYWLTHIKDYDYDWWFEEIVLSDYNDKKELFNEFCNWYFSENKDIVFFNRMPTLWRHGIPGMQINSNDEVFTLPMRN